MGMVGLEIWGNAISCYAIMFPSNNVCDSSANHLIRLRALYMVTFLILLILAVFFRQNWVWLFHVNNFNESCNLII